MSPSAISPCFVMASAASSPYLENKQTQRAAWTIGNKKNDVMETGLYNLTKDEVPALLHYGKDRTEQWLLVRVEQANSNRLNNKPATVSVEWSGVFSSRPMPRNCRWLRPSAHRHAIRCR